MDEYTRSSKSEVSESSLDVPERATETPEAVESSPEAIFIEQVDEIESTLFYNEFFGSDDLKGSVNEVKAATPHIMETTFRQEAARLDQVLSRPNEAKAMASAEILSAALHAAIPEQFQVTAEHLQSGNLDLTAMTGVALERALRWQIENLANARVAEVEGRAPIDIREKIGQLSPEALKRLVAEVAPHVNVFAREWNKDAEIYRDSMKVEWIDKQHETPVNSARGRSYFLGGTRALWHVLRPLEAALKKRATIDAAAAEARQAAA